MAAHDSWKHIRVGKRGRVPRGQRASWSTGAWSRYLGATWHKRYAEHAFKQPPREVKHHRAKQRMRGRLSRGQLSFPSALLLETTAVPISLHAHEGGQWSMPARTAIAGARMSGQYWLGVPTEGPTCAVPRPRTGERARSNTRHFKPRRGALGKQLGALLLWPSGLSHGMRWGLSRPVEHVDDSPQPSRWSARFSWRKL